MAPGPPHTSGSSSVLIGAKLMPWLLMRIAHTRSRELFILAVVALALGTALAATEFFGVSLALGAFLAGMVIGESEVSHQVGAEVIPFRDIFAVLFFVSVGMLVNPAALWANIGQVLALTALIVVGKALFTLLLGFVLPAPAHTMLVVAAGLSQIGEFSFIVGQSGVALGVLSQEQYGLILASALLAIVLNPLLFRAIPWAERQLRRAPADDLVDLPHLRRAGVVVAAVVGVRQQRDAWFDAEQLEAVARHQRGLGDLLGAGVHLHVGVEEEPHALAVDDAGHRRGAGHAAVEVEDAAQVAELLVEASDEAADHRIRFAAFHHQCGDFDALLL